jgi:cytochrome P450
MTRMPPMEPKNPIDAVTHRDPYPYYERLLAGPPLHFDDGLGLWVAARAAVVSEVLASPACHVRPTAEPVPAAISGLTAGVIFSHLIRMNDGVRHDGPKRALERALAALPAADVDLRARRIARLGVPTMADSRTMSTWMFDTPVSVVAHLLGFAEEEWSMVAAWTREFVACMSTLSTPEQLATASTAASLLQSRMQCLLQAASPHSGSLLEQVRAHAHAEGWADGTAIVANLVGLLSQTCEATAGLIGNAIVALATHSRLIDDVHRRADGWAQLVHETSRYDSPVQNTRRFVVERTRIAGIELEPGSTVLLVLAAANRDPSANSCPQEFRLDRPARCVFSFSHGAHACPGEALARGIAAVALAVLFETLGSDWLGRLTWFRRPSANGRLPVFLPV